MKVSITVDDRALQRSLTRTQREFAAPRALMMALGREFRDDVRDRINSRDNGSWAPASKWTRAKKNTNRALAGQARNISYRLVNDRKAEVIYSAVNSQGKQISITEHHFGKVLSADGKLTSIPITNPSPLRLPSGTSKFYFRWRKSAVVPARKIWPDAPGEAAQIAKPVLSKWVNTVVARSWK